MIIREDENLRRRAPGEAARLIEEGAQAAQKNGGRATKIVTVLDELEATNKAIDAARPNDVVVICADKHARVMATVEERTHLATPGAHSQDDQPGDPDFSPDQRFTSVDGGEGTSEAPLQC